MELKAAKRARGAKDKEGRKRRRTNPTVKSAPSSKILKSQGTFVGADELAWKEVELPDRLEDAEGFFGLEEVDEVEVVRHKDVVQYKVGGLRRLVMSMAWTDFNIAGPDGTDVLLNAEFAAESRESSPATKFPDWEGFDEESSVAPQDASPGRRTRNSKESKARSKKEVRAKNEAQKPGDPAALSNGYDILEESDDEGADGSFDLLVQRVANVYQSQPGALWNCLMLSYPVFRN